MRYFSTFSGIGGFEVGIHRAWRSVKGQRQSAEAPAGDTIRRSEQLPEFGLQGLDCVGYSEIDKYASSVYEYHFKGTKNYGDITKINAEELPDFDCLVGGFPCQAFSIAGKRRGFDDTRGTLFFDLARILREKQPRYFVFENVKGLLSHDQGNTFRTIIAAIDELGYDCQWQVLNSKDFGVPQNRERVIIVGHLRGTPRPEVFPIGEPDGVHTEPVTPKERLHQVAATQTARQYASWSGNFVKELTGNTQQSARVYDNSGVSPTLSTMQGGQKQPKVVTGDAYIRRLTPKECERLQGFPDDWTKYQNDGSETSDTQRYKMCGNAVTTNVIQAVFERILA